MKKLREKLIRTTFFSVVVAFMAVSCLMYFLLSYYHASQSDDITEIISSHDFTFPQLENWENFQYDSDSPFGLKLYKETSDRTRYFIVEVDEFLNVTNCNLKQINSVTKKQADEYAAIAISKNKTTGYLGNYRFRVVENSQKHLYTVIFLDCTENLVLQRHALFVLSCIAGFFTIFVTCIFALFSKRIMQPFEENSKRQKQFITDASHELKTPLAIISANAQVLEYTHGQSDWTDNIISQTSHMSQLINELLTLAKTDELEAFSVFEEINFVKIIKETIEPFREVAQEKQANISLVLPESLCFYSNKDQLKQLVSILTDNAVKYASSSGEIVLTLTNTKRYVTLKVFNTCEPNKNVDCKRLFDRFYRPDSSRTSSTGGHGIGLSIAKKLTTQLGGGIDAKWEEDGICFTASLAYNRRPTRKKWLSHHPQSANK